MKIILFSRKSVTLRPADIDEIFAAIASYRLDYTINREFAEAIHQHTAHRISDSCIYEGNVPLQSGDAVMVCYGGDGTLLEGVHRLAGADVPVVGINSGHLGFLALAPRSEISAVFEAVATHSLSLERRRMLAIDGEFEGCRRTMYALNEVAVQRLGATMIAIEAEIDGQRVSTYCGDGIIVSTPTGSTAYSLSAGGPVIAPSCRCMVLTPLTPHNLTMRPIVVPDSVEVVLRINTRGNAASVSADNRTCEIEDGAVIRIKSAENGVLLAVPHNISYFDTLRNKMMWGIDVR
ncbi:MAG: NAD(+)/NADH kinase [Alistipes sp.]|nr:NAD(+)/NADH kinase [Alistipes sp.]